MQGRLGWAWVVLLAISGCERGAKPTPSAEAKPAVAVAAEQGTYAGALAAIDRQLADARELAAARDGWADHELVAQLLVRRARLTGSIDDWVAADQALTAGFAVAPAGGGPVLTRLELDLSLHRLAQAELRIAQVEAAPLQTGATKIQLETARGELAAQRGDLEAARRAFERARELGADPGVTAGRMALLARRRGEYDAALSSFEASFEAARVEASEGQGAAWLLLQAGLVEWTRERPEAALRNYAAAEQAFPGWWLVAEHRAEALAALGRTAEAELLYRDVIERTGHPEFMDALAELLASSGHDDEAQTWIAAARREHERRLAALPEGAGAHALDHLIQFAPHEPRTLELARRVAQVAPNEDNLCRLAELLLTVGQPEAARAALEQARANGAESAELARLTQLANEPVESAPP
ncbi:tetratricopeptide repeat protein [Enhygromyxa salina]|uniref:Beta-barrel assembly-enhancing protease n=1 Tax=Enhygromyxa salina TaxID=215803 RepID=A0A2S9YMZ3_9BACT|nr:tetratricopeptide repeat protein [Enhygromyxa salina]PRQ06461.1 Beta-barrel assembly-enhancing protease [Enhygromyxa salina]